MSIGHTVFYFEQTASTNLLAKNLIERGASNGSVVVAGTQFSGKGQGNKIWLSNPNENLLTTIILKPHLLNPEEIFVINMAIACSVAATIENLCADEVFIKWPNDIYVKNKKISGLLLESAVYGKVVKYLCAGIGLNINQSSFPQQLNAISLKILNNSKFQILEVLALLCKQVNKRLDDFNMDRIINEYNKRLWLKNQKSLFLINGKKTVAQITSVDKNGRLVIETDNGQLILNHGEIGFLFNEN